MVGKWHLGRSSNACLPMGRGFDTFFGIYGALVDYFTHIVSKTGPTLSGHDFWDNGRAAKELVGQYTTHLYAKRAEEIIASHGNGTVKKPMFMYLAMQAPHYPLQVPKEYLTPYLKIKDPLRKDFAGMVACLDEAVKNVTMALDKYGIRNNTVIIFSSDNGGIGKTWWEQHATSRYQTSLLPRRYQSRWFCQQPTTIIQGERHFI
ncbi:arylsulfatase I-like isoform X1 [Amphiura filiformis]|uniref:arylsulfatase I-like isoform X1 n=1 Tax=Amphiura filiformis TaxID=82378 RepID=UPI003B228608